MQSCRIFTFPSRQNILRPYTVADVSPARQILERTLDELAPHVVMDETGEATAFFIGIEKMLDKAEQGLKATQAAR